MKADFSKVLIKNGDGEGDGETCPCSPSSPGGLGSQGTKALLFTALLLLVGVGVALTLFQAQISSYERRILTLEKDLDRFIKGLMPDEEFDNDNGLYSQEEGDLLGEEGSTENLEDYYANDLDRDLSRDPDSEELLSEKLLIRTRRQIAYPTVMTFAPEVERTGDGVPVIEEGYRTASGHSPFQHGQRQRSTTEDGFTLYDRSFESSHTHSNSNSGVKPHHHVSAAWSGSGSGSRSDRRLQLKSGDIDSSENPFSSSSSRGRGQGHSHTHRESSRRRHTQQQQQQQSDRSLAGSGYSGSTFHRGSRVPTTGDYYPPAPTTPPPRERITALRGNNGEVLARVVQDDPSSGENVVATSFMGQSGAEARRTYRRPLSQGQGPEVTSHAQTWSRRKGTNSRDEDDDDLSMVKAEAWVEGPAPSAAHFVADVSNYTTAHKHYDGNGRLRNADGIFEAWRPAEWMTPKEVKNSFVLNSNGVLTVRKGGLYYIYAQIHYLDEHDINGFIVQVGSVPFLQCTTMTETYSAGSKSNSCFTAGIARLRDNDRLLIKDIETNRYSIFKPEKSFFGLMKVGSVP